MIKFLSVFFYVIGKFSPFVAFISKIFPTSFYLVRKNYIGEKKFISFVVCKVCHKIYHEDQCKAHVGTQTISKKCSHVKFPNHPHLSRRRECSCLLLKTVQTKSTIKLLPFKFIAIIASLIALKGFVILRHLFLIVNYGGKILQHRDQVT